MTALLATAGLLADLAPEQPDGEQDALLLVIGIAVVVAGLAALIGVVRRRRSDQRRSDDTSTLAVLPALVVLADAGPTGGVLIGFLVFVLVLFAVFIGLVVLAVLAIRKKMRSRRMADH